MPRSTVHISKAVETEQRCSKVSRHLSSRVETRSPDVNSSTTTTPNSTTPAALDLMTSSSEDAVRGGEAFPLLRHALSCGAHTAASPSSLSCQTVVNFCIPTASVGLAECCECYLREMRNFLELHQLFPTSSQGPDDAPGPTSPCNIQGAFLANLLDDSVAESQHAYFSQSSAGSDELEEPSDNSAAIIELLPIASAVQSQLNLWAIELRSLCSSLHDFLRCTLEGAEATSASSHILSPGSQCNELATPVKNHFFTVQQHVGDGAPVESVESHEALVKRMCWRIEELQHLIACLSPGSDIGQNFHEMCNEDKGSRLLDLIALHRNVGWVFLPGSSSLLH